VEDNNLGQTALINDELTIGCDGVAGVNHALYDDEHEEQKDTYGKACKRTAETLP